MVQDDGTISSQEQELTKTMTYDYYGNLIREEGDGIDTARYTYDNKNRLTKKEVLKENGVYSTVEYDYTVGSDTKTVITDELGAQTQVNYDPLGRYESTVLLTEDGNITTESVTYDDLGRVNRKTVSDGNGKSYSVFTNYWSSGKLYKEEIRDSLSNIQRKTEYYYTECWQDSDEYDTNAQRVEIIQTDGEATRTSYAFVDVYGNTRKTIDTAGGVTTYDFDSKGELESMKNPNDNANQTTTPSESYTYDYRGEPLTVTNADGNTATTTYDFLGRAVTATDYSGNPTNTTYNRYGQQASVSTLLDQYIDPDPSPSSLPDYSHYSLTEYFYDSDGNLAIEKVKTSVPGAETDTYRQVNYVYDEHLRLDYVKQTEDDGTNTYIKYFYDVKGNPLKVVTGLSSVANLTETNIPETSAVTTYEYHPYLNTVTKMVLPDGSTQYYDYNYWGQIEEQGYLDSDNQKYGIVTSTYNTIGELLSSTGEDDSGAVYTYNKFGDVTQVVDDSGTRTFTYDTAGRLINESGANGNKAYTYDGNGNRTSFSLVQDNQTIQEQTYTYDRLNRLTQVKDANENELASYSYDANSNLTSEVRGTIRTNYTYTCGGQLIEKYNFNLSPYAVISDYDYTYYLDGNIKSENNRTFTYDNLGRLKQEQDGTDTISYSYDRFGNRSSMNNNGTTTSYTYDLNNRLLKEISGNKTTFYNYDDKGNLYSKRTDETSSATDLLRVDFFGELKNNADSTVELYFYNGLNRLEEVRKGGITAQYQYNAEGIRTSKTVNGTTTNFYLDGANVIAESVNGNTTNYVRGDGGIISSEILGSGNSRKYYTSDGHGNITNLINNSGAVVKTYAYDAFGVEENIDSTDINPFRYCGEYYDSEINQIYLRARYYDPSLGRFTQQDTYWNSSNMIYDDEKSKNNEFKVPSLKSITQANNTYVYCLNNPVDYWDSNGHFVICGTVISSGTIAAAGGAMTLIALMCDETFWDALYDGLYTLGKNIHDSILFAKGKTKAPKPPSSLKDGDKIKTPDTHKEEFQKNKDGSYTHKKSGWKAEKAKGGGQHGGPHWDMSPKRGNGHVNVDNNGNPY